MENTHILMIVITLWCCSSSLCCDIIVIVAVDDDEGTNIVSHLDGICSLLFYVKDTDFLITHGNDTPQNDCTRMQRRVEVKSVH